MTKRIAVVIRSRETMEKNIQLETGINMRNYDIIKEIYKITKEQEHLSSWERDGVEQVEKIKKLIEHRRPLNFPTKEKKNGS